jgi:hypothetical protein
MEIIKKFTDFCESTGNAASVLGLLVSLLGFWFTIKSVITARKAAQQAALAAKQARDKVLRYGTMASFSSAIAVMEELVRLYRKREWQLALDRHSELRRLLIELKTDSTSLTSEQQTIIQGAVEQFNTIEGSIEKFNFAGKPEPNVARINGVIKDQITNVHSIATSLIKN